MQSSFFNFKIIAIIFIVLAAIVISFLSKESNPKIIEVTKEIELAKPN